LEATGQLHHGPITTELAQVGGLVLETDGLVRYIPAMHDSDDTEDVRTTAEEPVDSPVDPAGPDDSHGAREEESAPDPESMADPGADQAADQAEIPSTDAEGPAARDDEDADADVETLEAPVGLGEPEVTTERVVEAILFASDAPLPLSKIVSILGVGSARDVRNHMKALNEKYERTGASFRIEQIASGYQMLTLPVYNTWIRRLKQTKQDSRLSQAAMETLAVVAYKQPVVRAEIEAIRGVSAGEMLNRLRELGLIKIVGRAEDVGRPMLYGTTRRFLEVFGLSGIEDLPEVEEMQPGE
jgi:segregation and condensation protein B